MSSKALTVAQTHHKKVLLIHIITQSKTITFYCSKEWLLKQISTQSIYNILHHFHQLHVIIFKILIF